MVIVDKINSYESEGSCSEHLLKEIGKLTTYNFKRQFVDILVDSKGLRLSEAGKCPRQLAYKYHGYEKNGKQIDSRGRTVFYLGDQIELMVFARAKLAGVNIMGTGFDQQTVSLKVGEHTIKGHPDGIVITDKGMMLFECKSMSSFSWKTFDKDGTIDESYLTQINVYMHCLKLNKCVLVGVNKDSGVLSEHIYEYDPEIVKSAVENLKSVLESKDANVPRKYGPNDKGHLVWQCVYCGFYGHCWPEAEKIVSSGRYVLKVKGENNE